MFNRWLSYGAPNFPFITNKESPQARGLIAWWPSLNNYSFRDFTESGLNGTFSGNASVVSEPVMGFSTFFGGAGTSDIVTISDDPKLDISDSNFSISFWMRRNGTSNTFPRFINKGSATKGYGFQLFSSTDKVNFIARRSSVTTRVQTNSSVLSGILYHICGTFDGSAITIYVNGLNDNGGASGAFSATADLIIGGAAGSQRWGGNISDLRLYNRLLLPIEVYQIFSPQTRWDLYRPLHRPLGFSPVVPAIGILETLFKGSGRGEFKRMR